MKPHDKKAALAELSRLYPDARPALHYKSAYELLVAVILSAQCTDERVNKVTEKLFEEHSTPETMCALTQEQLEKYIFSCGLYKTKAEHILSASRDISEHFGGKVPDNIKDAAARKNRHPKLQKLRGAYPRLVPHRRAAKRRK